MRPQRTRAVHRGQDSGLLSFRIRARVPSGSRCHLVSCTAGVRAAWAPRERFSVQVCLVSVLCARYRYRRRITYARTSECRSALFFMLARAHMQPAAHGDHTADADTRASRDRRCTRAGARRRSARETPLAGSRRVVSATLALGRPGECGTHASHAAHARPWRATGTGSEENIRCTVPYPDTVYSIG